MKLAIYFPLSFLILSSCVIPNNDCGYKYSMGDFPTAPTNLTEYNSEYDDYNCSAPGTGATFPFCFSSNRRSKGGSFDIVYKPTTVYFDFTTGDFSVFEETNSNSEYSDPTYFPALIESVNGPTNEFGPYLISEGAITKKSYHYSQIPFFYLLFAREENDQLDVMYTNFDGYIYPLKFLNTVYDDAYPSFSDDLASMYFTSNREGQFDIFTVNTNTGDDLAHILIKDSLEIEKNETLSSSADDKCPFIYGDLIVFTSDRPGGFGGFDLYYSRKENGQWNKPVNFGPSINTEYDEYRPIIKPFWEFSHDMMIFSSNRPGGKGGFDLYYVGIEKIETNKYE